MPLAPGDAPAVKSRLDRLMKTYGPAYLDSDPLGLVHRHPHDVDREAAAYSAASARGRRRRSGNFESMKTQTCSRELSTAGSDRAILPASPT